MAAWLDAVLSPLNAASETVQKLVEIRDAVKLGETTLALQAQIRAAYQAASTIQQREAALREENEALKRCLADLDTLNARKARYELKRLPPGAFVYSLKRGVQPIEEPHYACQICYENGKISILHSTGVHNGLEEFHCNGCGAKLKTGEFQPPPVQPRSSWVNARRGI